MYVLCISAILCKYVSLCVCISVVLCYLRSEYRYTVRGLFWRKKTFYNFTILPGEALQVGVDIL